MTGDVRAFYAAIGVDLPQWATTNASVRCFANPEAHAHEDRMPSCSVNLGHGAWRCWGCGACGGAYDAALARGHSPASAIGLMVEHGLTERRRYAGTRQSPRERLRVHPAAVHGPPAPAALRATDTDVRRWHQALFSPHRSRALSLVCQQRLWDPAVMRELELGYDRGRITIPIRDDAGRLVGVLRYRPGSGGRKMLALPGSRLGLVPHPAQEPSQRVVLVEGPPDMIAARSFGWPAIAVPGDHAWQATWAPLFRSREVTVAMDCDSAGRAAAKRIAADLAHVCPVRVIDLAPVRHDGFDLTDWLHSQLRIRRLACERFSSSKPAIRP